MQDYSKIANRAKKALDYINNGKNYPAEYVINRFEIAANKHPTDQLIGNMRDVFSKKASSQNFFTQSEITEIYDHMIGLSGGRSAFRTVLGDLLPEKRQILEKEASQSNLRKFAEVNPLPVYEDSELSDAFSVLFSLGNSSSFGTYKEGQDTTVKKVVVAELNTLGHPPTSVEVVAENEHFALCLAHYNTSSFRKVSVHIPVQISGGVAKFPECFLENETPVPLNKRNLLLHLKDREYHKKKAAINKFAGERGETAIKMDNVITPAGLEEYTDLENNLILAANNFNTSEVSMAITVVSTELASIGAINPHVKVGSSDSKSIILDAYVPTPMGKSVIHIPVEFHNGKPILPSRFAADSTSTEKIFDFSRKGFSKFMSQVSPNSDSLKTARQTGDLNKMSYYQLMDRVLDGVANKDYRLSQDALLTIQEKFSGSEYRNALNKYAQLLKHSSENSGTTRDKMIEAAVKRGDLIKVSTSVELYSPKLCMPLSKIDFDDDGRVIPKGRRSRTENALEERTLISTNKIVLT